MRKKSIDYAFSPDGSLRLKGYLLRKREKKG